MFHLIRGSFSLFLFLLLVSACGVNYGEDPGRYPDGTTVEGGVATNPDLGLVAGLTLDNNIDGSSPVGLSGTTWKEGVQGEALEFAGYDRYARLPDSPVLTLADGGSVMAWVRPDTHTTHAGVVHKGELSGFPDEAWSLQFWLNGGQTAIFLFNDAMAFVGVYSTTWLPTGVRSHLAATWDPGTIRLYINGVLNAWKPNSIGSVRDSPGGLIMGAQLSEIGGPLGHYGFDGAVDEIQIYNRALGAAEIKNVYLDGWP